MPFSGFLKPKPSGGRKPMIGKQIITPGSANTPINFGFHDGTGYSSAVVVPVANVLAGTTIAGQAGTMPSKLAENLGTLGATLLNLITNGNFANGTTGWTFGSGTSTGVSVASNVLTFTPTAQYGGVYQLINYPDGHIIYVSATIKAPLANGQNMQMWGGMPIVSTTLDNVFQQISMRFSNTITTKNLTITNNNTSGLGAVSVKNIVAIDLTAAFGAGLEPTQAQMDAIMTALGGWFDGNVILSKIASGGYLNNGVLGTPEVLLNDPNHKSENIKLGITDFGVAGGVAGASSLTAGANIVHLDNSVVSTIITTLTKIYELKMLIGGSIRFIFDLLYTSANGWNAYAQIYKNGIAIGTLRQTTSQTYVTFSEDITFSANDLLQIYAKTDGTGAQVSNIKLGSSAINPAIVRTL